MASRTIRGHVGCSKPPGLWQSHHGPRQFPRHRDQGRGSPPTAGPAPRAPLLRHSTWRRARGHSHSALPLRPHWAPRPRPRGTSQHCTRPGCPPGRVKDQRTRAWEPGLPCGPHAEVGTGGRPHPSLLLSQDGVRVTGDTFECRPVFPGKISGGRGRCCWGWGAGNPAAQRGEARERRDVLTMARKCWPSPPSGTGSPTAWGQGHGAEHPQALHT